MTDTDNIKFPVLSPNHNRFPPAKGTKSRSLTEAEIASGVLKPAEIDVLAENLKQSEPPMSLDQSRKRRATIKQDRKAAIDFIKGRTVIRRASRAAAMGIQGGEMKHDNIEVRVRSASAAISMTSGSYKSSGPDGLQNYAEVRASLAFLEEGDNKE
jgi:hypothetical protein